MYETGTIVRNHFDFSAFANYAESDRSRTPIVFKDWSIEIDGVVEDLVSSPEWNKYGARREAYGTPHTQMSDLWVRYNAWENFDPVVGLSGLNAEHKSTWYPIVDEVPELKRVIDDVLACIGGSVELGGVLITAIPPGGEVAPHIDTGWHAEYYYDKYAVQLLGNENQSFNFAEHSVSALPGQVYWFNNQEKHWVYNDSNEMRMTMIICVRPKEK